MKRKISDKILRSINLQKNVVAGVLKLAKLESRNFSSMVNIILKNFIQKENESK